MSTHFDKIQYKIEIELKWPKSKRRKNNNAMQKQKYVNDFFIVSADISFRWDYM